MPVACNMIIHQDTGLGGTLCAQVGLQHGHGRIVLEHFHIEIVYSDKMLWPCETQCSKAREIGVGDNSAGQRNWTA